MKITDVIAFRL